MNKEKLKKLFTKNEMEDIEKCLISMSEEESKRHELGSTFSDNRTGIIENQTSISEIETPHKLQDSKSDKKDKFQSFGNNDNKINIHNNINPNLIYSSKNSNFKNLKSKNEIKNRSNSNYKENNQNKNKNNIFSNEKFSKNNLQKNINYNSGYDTNPNNFTYKNQIAYDVLSNLPNKIFIDSEEYNKLKYKSQSNLKTEEIVNKLFLNHN